MLITGKETMAIEDDRVNHKGLVTRMRHRINQGAVLKQNKEPEEGGKVVDEW